MIQTFDEYDKIYTLIVCRKLVDIDNAEIIHNKIETYHLPISYFFNIQQDTKLDDYWNFDHKKYETSIIDGNRVFYLVEDKSDPDKYIQKEDIGELPIRQVKRKITRQSITNGELIWINIQRYIYHTHVIHKNIYNAFFEINIVPEETVLVDGIQKNLQYIHCFVNNHYILFFKCTDTWMLYDDNYNIVDITSDYFKHIGTYAELLEYTAFGVHKIVQKHSTLLMYV